MAVSCIHDRKSWTFVALFFILCYICRTGTIQFSKPTFMETLATVHSLPYQTSLSEMAERYFLPEYKCFEATSFHCKPENRVKCLWYRAASDNII